MADNTTPPEGGLAPLARFIAKQERKPLTIPLSGIDSEGMVDALLVPDGYSLKDVKPILDAFRLRPALRQGSTTLTDLASFIAWANRHKDEGSVIYADDNMAAPSLTAVIDHDEAGAEEAEKRARFGRHRATYAFPFSREWTEWTRVSGKALGATEFAEFFERRIGDVVPPPYSLDGQGTEVFNSQDPEIRKLVIDLGKRLATSADLVKLTRGIEINVDAKAVQKINRDTGEYTLEFAEENGTGVDRIKPPNAFLIAIPVVSNGTPILIAVHLRYRAKAGAVTWTIELHQPDRVFEEMFRQALETVAADTGLKPLRGNAPAAR
jgi:hypothetical protein